MKISESRKNAFRAAYKTAWKTELRECYASWSYEKQKAYDYQRRLCYDSDGYDFRILSATGWFFSVGYLFPDRNTGVIMLHVATGRNTYEFEY